MTARTYSLNARRVTADEFAAAVSDLFEQGWMILPRPNAAPTGALEIALSRIEARAETIESTMPHRAGAVIGLDIAADILRDTLAMYDTEERGHSA